jgi:LPPG:FO 2-phospho-L-lactate transferase
VLYTLAGVNNPKTGWGRAGETWRFMQEMKRVGGEDWFQLGDRDLVTHVLRREALRRGEPLSKITQDLATRFGIGHRILPMSDTPVRTRVKTAAGELAFQDYFVRQRCAPRVTGFRFAGARNARVPDALARVLHGRVDAVVMCPSNPFVSIAPIVSVPAIRAWLKARRFPVIAVSPIIGGAAVKGPAAKIMRELGLKPTALDVARHYGNAVDGWVIDQQDCASSSTIASLGKHVMVTDTLMTNRRKSTALARRVLAFARGLN